MRKRNKLREIVCERKREKETVRVNISKIKSVKNSNIVGV